MCVPVTLLRSRLPPRIVLRGYGRDSCDYNLWWQAALTVTAVTVQAKETRYLLCVIVWTHAITSLRITTPPPPPSEKNCFWRLFRAYSHTRAPVYYGGSNHFSWQPLGQAQKSRIIPFRNNNVIIISGDFECVRVF